MSGTQTSPLSAAAALEQAERAFDDIAAAARALPHSPQTAALVTGISRRCRETGAACLLARKQMEREENATSDTLTLLREARAILGALDSLEIRTPGTKQWQRLDTRSLLLRMDALLEQRGTPYRAERTALPVETEEGR